MHTPPDTSGNIFTMFISFFAGVFLQVTEPLAITWDFPPLFLHCLQIIAWTVSIIGGCISFYKWSKKGNIMGKYFKGNSKKAIKLAMAVKSLTAGLAAMSYFSGKPGLAMIIGAIGLTANEVINFLSDGESKGSGEENRSKSA